MSCLLQRDSVRERRRPVERLRIAVSWAMMDRNRAKGVKDVLNLCRYSKRSVAYID
jgi:hypothetical protein